MSITCGGKRIGAVPPQVRGGGARLRCSHLHGRAGGTPRLPHAIPPQRAQRWAGNCPSHQHAEEPAQRWKQLSLIAQRTDNDQTSQTHSKKNRKETGLLLWDYWY